MHLRKRNPVSLSWLPLQVGNNQGTKGATTTEMKTVTQLSYMLLGWDDDAGVKLFEALRHAHTRGGLQKLKKLDLRFNDLGDETISSLAAFITQGGLANLEQLFLSTNAISGAGMDQLASALERGGLPACNDLQLKSNPGDDGAVRAVLQQRRHGGLVGGVDAPVSSSDELAQREAINATRQ